MITRRRLSPQLLAATELLDRGAKDRLGLVPVAHPMEFVKQVEVGLGLHSRVAGRELYPCVAGCLPVPIGVCGRGPVEIDQVTVACSGTLVHTLPDYRVVDVVLKVVVTRPRYGTALIAGLLIRQTHSCLLARSILYRRVRR